MSRPSSNAAPGSWRQLSARVWPRATRIDNALSPLRWRLERKTLQTSVTSGAPQSQSPHARTSSGTTPASINAAQTQKTVDGKTHRIWYRTRLAIGVSFTLCSAHRMPSASHWMQALSRCGAPDPWIRTTQSFARCVNGYAVCARHIFLCRFGSGRSSCSEPIQRGRVSSTAWPRMSLN
jgi:hypothetical protein